MTDEEINAAIAEVCGWKRVEDDPDYEPYWQCPGSGRKVATANCPYPSLDYCNDLNAMHEAENSFPQPSDFYRFNLVEVCGSELRAFRATARQRAEAFLKTIGKWEDAK